MDSQALQVSEPKEVLSPRDVKQQVQTIQQIMKEVMKPQEHYGTVPGCGDKPTLLKPGAEKLMMTFRLAPDYVILPLFPGDPDKIGYQVECRISSITSGNFLGAGVGSASTEEDKWKWRKAVNEEEYEETDPDRTRIKYGVNYRTKENYQIKQVRTNPADQANTVLKMAKKRALVDAILTVCAASDIFTQDLEEMPSDTAGPIVPVASQSGQGEAATTVDTPPPSDAQIIREQTDLYGYLMEFSPKSVNGKNNFLTFEVDGQPVKVSSFHLPEGWPEDILHACIEDHDRLVFQFKNNTKNGRTFQNLSKLQLYSPVTAPSEEYEAQREAEDAGYQLTSPE